MKVSHCIYHSVQHLYVHWGVNACLLIVGLKWSVITDVLVVSGYFDDVSRLVNRQELVWGALSLFWFLGRLGRITTILPSIIFLEIIE